MEDTSHSEVKNLTDTIIICDGLTNSFVNPAAKFVSGKFHVGRDEAHRLMGKGRNFGKGPLPSLLREATQVRQDSAHIGIILLQTIGTTESSEEDFHALDDELHDFPTPLKEITEESLIIKTFPEIVPWQQISEAIEILTGRTNELDESERKSVRFLVTGCNTEGRPLSIATYLRNVLCYEDVAVSPHFVGSSAREAHFATLRHTFAGHRVRVILGLNEAAEYAGLDPDFLSQFRLNPCSIEPVEIQKALGAKRQRIVELICMHWTRCYLKPLSGGFSGSLLFLAEGWKDDARTEPMVMKIDSFMQMNREISGYYQVKDLLGKHIPSFGYPITISENIGVGMELASMEGQPETLQDVFEKADVENAFERFSRLLKKTLNIISERLYRNTLRSERIIPYHQFDINTDEQIRYLKQNAALIESYINEAQDILVPIDYETLPRILQLIASNDDGVQSEVCIAHGDINYQNIICDQADNIWFIDWTHCGFYPLELDFAKMESDAKFVLSKEFDLEDLPRIVQFEKYLLMNRMPSDEQELPNHLKFAKWDFRFRKILSTVRAIRDTCFALKQSKDWLVYKIALLRYALHTLSFDKRRGRGECEPQQLAHALISTQQLLLDLVSDDFHLKIRGERPTSYPLRQRISIDLVSWKLKCPEYSPPYHVDPSVLANDATKIPDGWADPEDLAQVERKSLGNIKWDDAGHPLHPRGRTGIAGRGLLGRWGVNPAVNAVIFRIDSDNKSIELLLGKHEEGRFLWLPKGFVPRGITSDMAVGEIIKREFGWLPESDHGEIIFEGFSYDPRQTDNAWIEISTFLFCYPFDSAPIDFNSDREFEEIEWWPVNEETQKNLHPVQAFFVKIAIKKLEDKGMMSTVNGTPIIV